MAKKPEWIAQDLQWGSSKFSRAITPAEVGLDFGAPGHALSNRSTDPNYGSVDLMCSCGFELRVSATATGKAAKGTRRNWEAHVDLHEADPSVLYDVGRIKTNREDAWIFVAPCTFPRIKEFGKLYGKWLVLWESDTSKKSIAGADTKQTAFALAIKELDKADRRGSKVTRVNHDVGLPDNITIEKLFGQLLERANIAEDLLDLDLIIEAIQAVVRFTPILAMRLEQLQAERERKLTAPFELAAG